MVPLVEWLARPVGRRRPAGASSQDAGQKVGMGRRSGSGAGRRRGGSQAVRTASEALVSA